ncbi:bifunctional diguanylate cyclase/phosphodiesterase, partial [Actinotalea sp. C106]|uniref:putative bifunctional diguanylate cyclase/phosphodiesterase n=1 Tax=Actinotalea sp. C106 TaxID=2908644 RepID=UPI002027E035
ANAVAGRDWPVATGFGLSNAAEAWVVAAWLLRGRARPRLMTLEDVFRLLAGTLLGGLVMGLGAAATVAILADGDPWITARTVMASHGAAILVTVPLGLRVLTPRAAGSRAEGLAQWVALLGVSALIFRPDQALPVAFLTMPFLVWGALRLGTRTVTLQLVVLALLVSALNRFGGGPFAWNLGSGSTVTASLVQAYLVVSALVVLPLAVSVAQRRAVLQRVEASERLFREGFSEALLGMLLLRRTSEDGRLPSVAATSGRPHATDGLEVVELNAVSARILGGTEPELVGESWTARLEAGDRTVVADAVREMHTGNLPGWHGEVALGVETSTRWVEVALSPLTDASGEGMFVGQMVDVTARRAAEERLTAQALQDGLTGLGNRTLLRDRIDLALRTLSADGSGAVLLYCDLDDFKHVNDSTGHPGGDSVLVEVAQRLTALLRPEDVAARLGGDEFVVLRPQVGTQAEAEELATAVLDALMAPLHVGVHSFSLGVSIGIAWGSPGTSPDDLLRDADSAMYAAKAEGKRRVVVFSDEHRARVLRAVRVEKDLRVALEREELEVYMQPVIDLDDGLPVAAEALVRWNHPERGLLAPGEWLDVAESSGLMPRIGAWVLERSCVEAATWPVLRDGAAPTVHVNVSARQLDEPGFVEEVRRVLTETGLAPARLVLEFTETYLDEVSDTLLADLAGLRRAGIGLAADDYGTGYSPLTRVIELPLSMVKIDRGFVSTMLEDVRSRAIVTTLLRLSEALGLDLVAEGVETQAQADELKRLGCQTGQGYLWSRPVPAEQFRAELSASISPGSR